MLVCIGTHHSEWRQVLRVPRCGLYSSAARRPPDGAPLTATYKPQGSAHFSCRATTGLDEHSTGIDVLQALPYDDLVPYDDFVVYVPSSHPGRHVLDTLSAIPLDRIRSMRAALDKYSKYLQYAPTVGSGRPIHTEANLVRSTAELDAANHTLRRQALLRRSQEEQVLAVRVLYFEIARRFAPEQRSAVGALVA